MVGECRCLWNQTLRGSLGSQIVFQVSSSQEDAAFLTLVWWIQGMTPVSLRAVVVARTIVRGAVYLLTWFFLPIFNQYLFYWMIGMNPIAQRNGCPFKGFSGDMVEDFSQEMEVSGHLQVSYFWGVSLEFSYHSGFYPI